MNLIEASRQTRAAHKNPLSNPSSKKKAVAENDPPSPLKISHEMLLQKPVTELQNEKTPNNPLFLRNFFCNPFVTFCNPPVTNGAKPVTSPEQSDPLASKPASKESLSPVALSWLRENRQALQCNGWTMAELYRRNKSKGIAWAGVWDIPGMTATLQGGVITITFQDNGRTITQTARPDGLKRFKTKPQGDRT